MRSLRKAIAITRVEQRDEDAWFDFGLRQLRRGQVRFYKVRDAVSGEWLFKVCQDKERGRAIVKALKCPRGMLYAQLEGDSMVFSKSQFEGYLYDVVAIAHVESNERLAKRFVASVEDLPSWIRDAYPVKPYLEATGRNPTFGRGCVTLVKDGDERGMICLFLLEKAWPISVAEEDTAQSYVDIIPVVRELESADLDTVYETVQKRHALSKEDAERLVSWSIRIGKLISPAPGRVKAPSRR